MRLPSFLSEKRILGGTVILAFTQLLASAAGLLRDRLLFQTFPALNVTDVYFAAFRPSDFLFQACILSALGTVLVPVLAAHHTHGRREELDRILSGTIILGATVFGALALLLAVFLPWLAPHLVHFQGEELALYVQFGRLALISNFLFVFGSTFGQHLITVQRYWIYGLTPILYTIGTILGTVFLTPRIGAYGPITGTILGAFLYATLRAIDVLRTGVRFRWTLWHPDFHSMGLLMLPRMLSLGAMQLQLLIFDTIGSGLATGSVSINLAARNFQAVGVGVVGIALAQAVYSPLSQSAARKDRAAYMHYLRKAVSVGLLLTIPASLLLVALAPVAASLVHLTDVLPVFRIVLIAYALSIPLESMSHVLLRASYAMRDTLIPALCAVAGGCTAILVAHILDARIGIAALGVAFTVGQGVQVLGLAASLPRRIRTLS
jgi:putative peptidoglycan lipid II flippase